MEKEDNGTSEFYQRFEDCERFEDVDRLVNRGPHGLRPYLVETCHISWKLAKSRGNPIFNLVFDILSSSRDGKLGYPSGFRQCSPSPPKSTKVRYSR